MHTETDARVAVVRRDAAGRVIGRFAVGGSFVKIDDQSANLTRRAGSVVSVDPQQCRIRIRVDQADKPEEFLGRAVQFRNELRRTTHSIVAAARDGDTIVLTPSDDVIVGRARVDEARADALTTKTAMPFAATYPGAMVTDSHFRPLARVTEIEKSMIKLTKPVEESDRPAAGDDVWLLDIGPGDTFDLPAGLDDSR
jgi:hypothetical protein